VQCADALVTAHSRGIVDCDLKSENIVPTATEQVKSLDFGVPKRFARSDKSSTAEKTRGLAGTPTYKSPGDTAREPFWALCINDNKHVVRCTLFV
jgi:serine/threonine protein kinase